MTSRTSIAKMGGPNAVKDRGPWLPVFAADGGCRQRILVLCSFGLLVSGAALAAGAEKPVASAIPLTIPKS